MYTHTHTYTYVNVIRLNVKVSVEMSRVCQSMETEGRLLVARGWGKRRREMRSDCSEYKISFWGDRDVLELLVRVV